MLKKFGMLLLAVVLVFGLTVGCGGGSDDGGGIEVPFEFTDFTKDTYKAWGNNAPTITDDGWLEFEASSSTGFYINFADIGYTLNRTDTMVITYEIDVTEPHAVLTAKVKSGNDLADAFGAGSASSYGRGGGREYVLGDETLSNYEVGSTYRGTTAIVEGTYVAATKTGTFEVKMSQYPANADNIAFQHNYWCDMIDGSAKIAEDSVYKLRFTKMENKVSNELLAPVISTQPQSARIPIGATEIPTLTVAADEAPEGATRTYQWQKLEGEDWTNISGATDTSLAIASHIGNAEEEGIWRFRAVVSNVRGTETASANSSAAIITVYDDAVPTTDIDLGAFTWINNDNQKGWKSGHCDDEDFDLEVEDVISASHLVLEVTSLPDGGMCMIWQGDGNSWNWAQGDNILEDDGTPKAGVEIEGNTIKIDLSVAIKDYSDFLASETGVKFLVQYYGGAVADIDALGIVRAYLTGVSVAPKTTDLDAFTWINNDNQKGWKSGHCDDEDFDLEVEDVVSAVYLVLEVTSLPDGGMCMIWQGDGNSWNWAQGDNILEDDGTPKAGVEIEGNTIKIDLSVAIKDYSDFLASETGVKFLVQYYGGAVADVDALGIVRAYLTY